MNHEGQFFRLRSLVNPTSSVYRGLHTWFPLLQYWKQPLCEHLENSSPSLLELWLVSTRLLALNSAHHLSLICLNARSVVTIRWRLYEKPPGAGRTRITPNWLRVLKPGSGKCGNSPPGAWNGFNNSGKPSNGADLPSRFGHHH